VSVAPLLALLDRWEARRVVVVGDFMLDRTVYGDADRLAPDAPVPVLAIDPVGGIVNTPGGAGNVSLCLAKLGMAVRCIGVVGREPEGAVAFSAGTAGDTPGGDTPAGDTPAGDTSAGDTSGGGGPSGGGGGGGGDAAAATIRRLLSEAGCDAEGLIVCADRPTTVKFSLVGRAQHRHPQKMFRADAESKAPIPPDAADRLVAAAEQALPDADILCLEDYGKGVLTPDVCQRLIAAAKLRGVRVLVDPAAIDDYRRYRGATCITPNRTEAAKATGETDPARAAAVLLDACDLDTVLITLDRHGALLQHRGDGPVTVPTRARDVYDVTGAGDMVLAMLAAALANGGDWPQAVTLANLAGGLEVERFGVVPISRDEVLLALLREHHGELGKLRPPELLLPEVRALRGAGKTIAFTNGCFDILHAGHVQYLRQARATGDVLVVGLNTDASIRRLKGEGRPVNPQDDRVLVLSELTSVDYVVLFDEDTPRSLIEAVRPDVLVKGADYTREQVVGHDIVEAAGGRVELVPLVEGRSTTNILRTISDKR